MPGDVDGLEFEGPLLDLASQDATGRLLITGRGGGQGWIWLRDGDVTGASGPGPRPLLANRLLAFGIMPRARIAKLISEARSRAGLRLFDLIMEKQAAPEKFLSTFVMESVAEQVLHIRAMGIANLRFENGRTTRGGSVSVPAHALLDHCQDLPTDIPGIPSGAPLLATGAGSDHSPVRTAILSRADGSRTLAQLAESCGLTQHETIALVEGLLNEEALGIAPDTPDTEPWEEHRPLPSPQDPSDPTDSEADPTTSSAAPGLVDITPEDAPPMDSRSAFAEGLAAAAAQAAESPTDSTGDSGPGDPAQPPPPAADQDHHERHFRTRREPTAAERRGALNDLAALSQEAAGSGPPPPPAAPTAASAAEAGSGEPEADEKGRKPRFGRRRSAPNPGAASAAFRELHSLADEEVPEKKDKKKD